MGYVIDGDMQDLFNQVCETFAEQKRQSANEDSCQYRLWGGQNGEKCLAKCGVGALIPDEKYQHEMENHSVDTLMVDFPYLINPQLTEFLSSIQHAHDNSDTLHELQKRLRNVADAFDLNDYAVSQIKEWAVKRLSHV